MVKEVKVRIMLIVGEREFMIEEIFSLKVLRLEYV